MYLKISNKGLTDIQAFTILGVSGSRGGSNFIGEFGSGAKYSLALLLRKAISPIITVGNLKLEFFTKPIVVNNKSFNQICVRYSGKDETGATKNYSEDLSVSLEFGIRDWKEPYMAVREFLSNAIDRSVQGGGSHKDVKMEVVNNPRCKAGNTCVYIPLTPEIQEVYNNIGMYFLHFGIGEQYLNEKIIPKLWPDGENVCIYKKGVLVSKIKTQSLFDYNLGDELILDESRNAPDWNVNYAVGKALSNAEPKILSQIISKSISDKIWETTLPTYVLQDGNKDNWINAFENAFGKNVVLTRPIRVVEETVRRKGFKPVMPVCEDFRTVLEHYNVPSDTKILDTNEVAGRIVENPTDEMVENTLNLFDFLEKNGFTYNKNIPDVKSFRTFTQGESTLHGFYENNCIYLNQELGGKELMNTILEELIHYITGSGDNTRDFQNFLLQIITSFIEKGYYEKGSL